MQSHAIPKDSHDIVPVRCEPNDEEECTHDQYPHRCLALFSCGNAGAPDGVDGGVGPTAFPTRLEINQIDDNEENNIRSLAPCAKDAVQAVMT